VIRSVNPKSLPLLLLLAVGSLLALQLSCGGGRSSSSSNLCSCVPTQPPSADFRHAAKHVPLPGTPATDITVAIMLSWPQFPTPAGDALRTGRELQMFHLGHVFVQLAYINHDDCDLHFEVSDSVSKSAPRAIMETPVDPEYCGARQNINNQLTSHGIALSNSLENGELPQALPADVLGLAFLDFGHTRGSPNVKTLWEIHPAIVTLTQ
jgi:hypothetical protein